MTYWLGWACSAILLLLSAFAAKNGYSAIAGVTGVFCGYFAGLCVALREIRKHE